MGVARVLDISDDIQLDFFQKLNYGWECNREERIRYERIVDIIYVMSEPIKLHSDIVSDFNGQLYTFFGQQGIEGCRIYIERKLNWDAYSKDLRKLVGLASFFIEKDEKKDYNIRVVPDLMVVCGSKDEDWGRYGYAGIPRLVVEVTSTSTYGNDVTWKKAIYEFLGVEEYWVIDISTHFKVIRFNLVDGKYVCNEFVLGDTFLYPSGLYDGFILDLSEVNFQRIGLPRHLF
jgi:Uma2 family endonuclease